MPYGSLEPDLDLAAEHGGQVVQRRPFPTLCDGGGLYGSSQRARRGGDDPGDRKGLDNELVGDRMRASYGPGDIPAVHEHVDEVDRPHLLGAYLRTHLGHHHVHTSLVESADPPRRDQRKVPPRIVTAAAARTEDRLDDRFVFSVHVRNQIRDRPAVARRGASHASLANHREQRRSATRCTSCLP